MGPALMTVKGRSIVVGGGLFCTTATLLLRMSPVTFPWPACPAAPAAAPASLPADTHTLSMLQALFCHIMRKAASHARQLSACGLGFGHTPKAPGPAAEGLLGCPDCMSSCLVSTDVVACRLPESLEPITTAHQHTRCRMQESIQVA